jgi:hypothetical protein
MGLTATHARTGALVLALVLSGCEWRVPGAHPVPGTARAPQGVVAIVPSFVTAAHLSLQALITENRLRIHHVNLRLFRRAPDGLWPQTPEVTRLGLPANQIGQPITLGFLKFATTYRLQAEAYASDEENLTTLLSDVVASRAEFTTPSPLIVGGALTVATTIPIALPLVLQNTPYAGQASYTIAVSNGQITHVRLDLTTPAGLVATRIYPRGGLPGAGTLSNLKLGTAYQLTATGLKGTNSPVSTAVVSFVTPTVSDVGTVDTGPFGPWALVLD